ncbi:hypothetical protein BCR44DRAFT_1441976, partial [Catenaria anguillulae PL171]
MPQSRILRSAKDETSCSAPRRPTAIRFACNMSFCRRLSGMIARGEIDFGSPLPHGMSHVA